MNEDVFMQIKKFTIKEVCLTKEKLDRSTKLYDELGISGDDAVEFILAFGKHFNVDISRFSISDYFHPEGYSVFSLSSTKKKKELTLAHLEKAAIAHRLDDEVINSL